MAAAHIAGRMPFVRGGVRMQAEEGAGWMTGPGWEREEGRRR